MKDVSVIFPEPAQAFIRRAIESARGNEVFFLGRLEWSTEGAEKRASLVEVEVVARGNAESVPAVLERGGRWDLAIHNHPSGVLEPSDADMVIAQEFATRSVGFAIVSNDAARQYVVVQPFERKQEETPIDEEEVKAVFAPGGPLARHCEDYEPRSGQVDMALEVARALNEGRVLAAEAGTGVGKSFAYLVPAILWATRNKKRVVVSTGTIHLQEQLTGKDLPLLASVLPVPFRHVLIKGRSNYACRRRTLELKEDLAQPQLVPQESREELLQLVEWMESSKDGSRSDLGWVPREDAWDQIQSETDKSLKLRCKHYHECFYYSVKRAASSADVLVINHHLFFADLAVRRETGNYDFDLVIPPYDRVIFDEAHHLEDVASDYLGVRFSRAGIRARLARLVSTRDRRRGILPGIVQRLRLQGDPVAAGSIEQGYGTSLEMIRERIEDRFYEVDRALEEARRLDASAGGSADSDASTPFQARATNGAESRSLWDVLLAKVEAIQSELALLVEANDRALATLERSSAPEERVESLAKELESVGQRLSGLVAQMDRFRDLDPVEHVRWVSTQAGRRRDDGASIDFAAAPVRVAEAMHAAVFAPLRSVVLTSATLSVGGSFDFLSGRLGLDRVEPERLRRTEHPSPFDYHHQVLTVVPSDLPLPESRSFESVLPEAVLKILLATGGRAFVLFTSYRLLRRAFEATHERLTAAGLRPLVQGSANRSELLNRFRSGAGNVLFGTDSFWEGVDVKGKALECVIITRLPFRVPSEPLQQARWEELERAGENPFTSFAVPQAVLKLKQGFGRLIRSRADRGVVAILDRRILTKPYGRTFLRSLPDTTLLTVPLEIAAHQIASFFESEPAEDRRPPGRPPWN